MTGKPSETDFKSCLLNFCRLVSDVCLFCLLDINVINWNSGNSALEVIYKLATYYVILAFEEKPSDNTYIFRLDINLINWNSGNSALEVIIY